MQPQRILVAGAGRAVRDELLARVVIVEDARAVGGVAGRRPNAQPQRGSGDDRGHPALDRAGGDDIGAHDAVDDRAPLVAKWEDAVEEEEERHEVQQRAYAVAQHGPPEPNALAVLDDAHRGDPLAERVAASDPAEAGGEADPADADADGGPGGDVVVRGAAGGGEQPRDRADGDRGGGVDDPRPDAVAPVTAQTLGGGPRGSRPAACPRALASGRGAGGRGRR